jgi:hypothetical protein
MYSLEEIINCDFWKAHIQKMFNALHMMTYLSFCVSLQCRASHLVVNKTSVLHHTSF